MAHRDQCRELPRAEGVDLTHRGKIDAIYIDPPYNSGAGLEVQQRLRQGRSLSPQQMAGDDGASPTVPRTPQPLDSVLIVTIDEKEYLRLGLLLEQTFPEGNIQMVTSVISPFGVARENELSRVDEYLFFVRIGGASLARPNDYRALLARNDDEEDETAPEENEETFWFSFMRAGSNSTRKHSPGCHYPIFVTKDGQFHSVGKPLPAGTPREAVRPPRGTVACWPIKTNKKDGVWQASADSAQALLRVATPELASSHRAGRHSITYLRDGTIQRIKANEVVLPPDGEITALRRAATSGRTVWAFSSHNATSHGTSCLPRFSWGESSRIRKASLPLRMPCGQRSLETAGSCSRLSPAPVPPLMP